MARLLCILAIAIAGIMQLSGRAEPSRACSISKLKPKIKACPSTKPGQNYAVQLMADFAEKAQDASEARDAEQVSIARDGSALTGLRNQRAEPAHATPLGKRLQMATTRKQARDAGNGQFTTMADARRRPSQTVVETIKPRRETT